MKIIIYCLFGIMFFFAISSTMTGILVPDLTETYHLNSMQIGLIGSVQSVGSMVAMIFGGILSDRFSKLRLIALFFAIYTVVLYLIGMVPAFAVLLVLYVLMGVANSYLNLLLSAFISEAYGEKRTTYLNMIHAFYSLGSLAGPVYATMVQKSGQHWNTSFCESGYPLYGDYCGLSGNYRPGKSGNKKRRRRKYHPGSRKTSGKSETPASCNSLLCLYGPSVPDLPLDQHLRAEWTGTQRRYRK